MDLEEKKGPRDIGDLKARLGLKKGTPAAVPAVPAAGTPAGVPAVMTPSSVPAPGAVPTPAGIPAIEAQAMHMAVPAPGIPAPNIPAPVPAPFYDAVPPPPGYVPPEPEYEPEPEPEPLDPRRDPFGAAQMQMQAYYGMPLPGEDDGKPAPKVEEPKKWGRIGVMAGVGLLLALAGYSCGRINDQRAGRNLATQQAGEVKTEVERITKTIKEIGEKIAASPVTKGQADVDLALALGQMDLKKPDTQKLFRINYSQFDDLIIDRLFGYYNNAIQLYDLIEKHAKATAADKEAIANAVKAATSGKSDKNYAVTLDVSGVIPLANFVELGPPVCPDPNQTNCAPNELKGFKYRIAAGAAWSERPLKGKNPADGIFPVQQSDFFKTIASGSPDVIALKEYGARTRAILKILEEMAKSEKDLVSNLQKMAERPKLFAL